MEDIFYQILFILIPVIGMIFLVKKNKTITTAAIGYYILVVVTGLITIIMLPRALFRGSDDAIFAGLALIVAIVVMLPFHYLNKRKEYEKTELWAGHLSALGHLILLAFVIIGLIVGDSEGFIWGLFMLGPVLVLPLYAISLILIGIEFLKRRREKKQVRKI